MAESPGSNQETALLGKLEPLKRADMPKVVGPLALLGPGVILASFGFGSGELIWWPYLAAKYGLALVWLMIPAGLMQWWINYELARYVVVTGESPWAAYTRISRVFSLLYWAFAIVTLAWWGGYAAAGGTALAALTGFPPGWSARDQTIFWALLSMVLSYVALVLSRTVHKVVELFVAACIVIGAGGVIVVAFHPAVAGAWPEFLRGLFTPNPLPPDWSPADNSILITSIAFLGLGGFFQLTYPMWLRAAGAGMAAYVPKLKSPITGKPEPIPATGYVPHDNEENRNRYRGWMRAVAVNNTWGVLINLFTTILMAYLAYAILHPKGLYPSGYRIVVEQANFWGEVWGVVGYNLFLLVGAALIIDTYIVILDWVPRLYTDVLQTNFERARKISYTRWYYGLMTFFAIWTAVTLFLAAPGELIVWGGVLNFLAWPVMHAAAIYVSYRMLPRAVAWARPGLIWLVVGLAITAIYTYLAVWYIGVTFKLI